LQSCNVENLTNGLLKNTEEINDENKPCPMRPNSNIFTTTIELNEKIHEVAKDQNIHLNEKYQSDFVSVVKMVISPEI